MLGEEFGTAGLPDELDPDGAGRHHQIFHRRGDGLRVDSVPPALTPAGMIDEDETEAFRRSGLANALHLTVRSIGLFGADAWGVEAVRAITVEVDDEAPITTVE